MYEPRGLPMSGIPAWPCDILVCTTFTIVPLLELHRRQCGHIAISMVMHAQPGADTDGHTHEFPGDSLVVFQEDCAGAGGHVPSAGGANPRAERGARPYKNGEYETAGNRRKQPETPENAGKRRKRAVRNSRKTPDNTRGRPLEPPRQGVAVTSDRSLICGTSCWTWLMFRGAAMWDTCEHRSWVREKGCCSGGDAYSGAGGVRRDAGGQQVLLPWYCC